MSSKSNHVQSTEYIKVDSNKVAEASQGLSEEIHGKRVSNTYVPVYLFIFRNFKEISENIFSLLLWAVFVKKIIIIMWKKRV